VEGDLRCSRVNIVVAFKFSFAFTTLRLTPANQGDPVRARRDVCCHGSVSAQVKRHKPKPVGVRYEGGAGTAIEPASPAWKAGAHRPL